MRTDFIDRTGARNDDTSDNDVDDFAVPAPIPSKIENDINQLKLFWNSNPKDIIVLLQVMQFFFAITAAYFLIFWDTSMGPGYHGSYYTTRLIKPYWFIIVSVFSFLCFLIIMAYVLPLYTLCTNLGQLVNNHVLAETLALWKFENIKKERAIAEAENHRTSGLHLTSVFVKPALRVMRSVGSLIVDDESETKPVEPKRKEHTFDLSRLVSSRTGERDLPSEKKPAESESERLETLASLVLMPSDKLPVSRSLSTASDKEARRRRRKTQSDGVMFMRASLQTESPKDSEVKDMLPLAHGASNISDVSVDSKSASSKSSVDSKPKMGRSRSWRKKAVSTGVDSMRSLASPPLTLTPTLEENEEEHEDTVKELPKKPLKRVSSGSALESLCENTPAPCGVSPSDLPVPLGRVGLMGNSNQRLMSEIDEPPSSPHIGDSDNLDSVADETDNTVTSNYYESDNDNDLPSIRHVPFEPAPEAKETRRVASYFSAKKFAIFLHTKYFRVIDFALGSMPVFFLVGMRMESLLTAGGHMDKSNNTWQLTLPQAFFLELIWLVVIAAVSIFKLLFFYVGKALYGRNTMMITASLDLAISGSCVALLLIAEAQRCCEPFGENIGLGSIEPFTGIIFFRNFRYTVGRKLYKKLFMKKEKVTTDSPQRQLSHKDSIQVADHALSQLEREKKQQLLDSERKHVGKEAHTDPVILELWNKAVGEHPEIAKEFGEFSGEMLQAMLGLPIGESKYDNFKKQSSLIMPNEIDSPRKTKDELLQSMENTDIDQEELSTKALEIETKFATLPEDVQEVICAGKIGKSVKIVSAASDIPENFELPKSPSISKVYINFNNEIIYDHLESDDEFVAQDLAAPDAELLRSMRRCHWKLLPLLKHWALVDVVMSKYEIVLFEANDMEELDNSEPHSNGLTESLNTNIDIMKRKKCVHDALIATKGGKGLRMRDVAVGRKVVGHLNLSDITSVTIDRLFPNDTKQLTDLESSHSQRNRKGFRHSNSKLDDDDIEMSGDACHSKVHSEYWKSGGYFHCSDYIVTPRFESVTEDRLKIVCGQGILYLRFFSDLEKSELNGEEGNQECGGKSDALIWCQSIVRICGPDALTQMQHFDPDDEEEHLVNIVPRLRNEYFKGGRLKSFAARASSFGEDRRFSH